ncbi:hypothetical protein GCM10009548_26200 [Streptomyces malaysiensis subsp. malaysiensis]
MVLNVGTVTVRLRLPSADDISMGPLAAFAVRCRCVVLDGLPALVGRFACEVFDAADGAAAVRDFVDVPPRAGAVFFAAVEELRLREVAGVVTGLTSTR